MTDYTPAGAMDGVRAEFRALLDRPLLPAQAARLESLAVTLAVRLEWQHIDLGENVWKPGRKPGRGKA